MEVGGLFVVAYGGLIRGVDFSGGRWCVCGGIWGVGLRGRL